MGLNCWPHYSHYTYVKSLQIPGTLVQILHICLARYSFSTPLLTWECDHMSIAHTLQPMHMEQPRMSTKGSVKWKDTTSTKAVGSVLYFLVITITLKV